MSREPLLRVEGLSKTYRAPGWLARSRPGIQALQDVCLSLFRGETLGLVGESGSGKTTLSRIILRLLEADSGSVRFDGIELLSLSPRRLRPLRRRMQAVFQDPYGSLNPRMKVGAIVGEGLAIFREGGRRSRVARVSELLELVGLPPSAAGRYPHEFSGGQRQRIGIARALALEPDFLICDEPVSSLDVSVQAQILNLLADLQDRLCLTCLFIAHDLAVVENLADRVAVMYRGRIVEVGPAATIYARPLHPYTRLLLDSVPVPDPAVAPPALPKTVSTPEDGDGCRFYPRCGARRPSCRSAVPRLEELAPGHTVACFRAGEKE